jgi:hypothetical protein
MGRIIGKIIFDIISLLWAPTREKFIVLLFTLITGGLLGLYFYWITH